MKWMGFLLAACLAAGCGDRTVPPDEAYDPAKFQGQVDTRLPAADQERQGAVKAVFDQIQRGTDWESLHDYHPGVTFSETEAAFWDGHLGLAAWSFDGPPQGIDVPVVLELRDKSDAVKKVKRRYRVSGSAGSFYVERTPGY